MILNEDQQRVIEAKDKKLLLVASAGSGKTTVLIEKVSNLVRDNQVKPSSVLMLTFSNKAAKQLKERLMDKIGPNSRAVTVATFHGFALKIIKEFIEFTDLSILFKIIDSEERNRYVATLFNELRISRYQMKEYKDNFSSYKLGNPVPVHFKELHQKLLDKLSKMKMIEIDDLIPIASKLLIENTQVLENIQRKYRYILVDEYQDVSDQQHEFIQPLVDAVEQFIVVGDDDQCIYEWRGSKPNFMLNLSKESDVKKIFLTTNYRSQKNIIELSNKIISKNKERITKEMVSTKQAISIPEFSTFDSDVEEAKYVAKKISNLYKTTGVKLDQIAILVRNDAQGIEIIKELRKFKLPFVNYNNKMNYKRWIFEYLKEISSEFPSLTKLINYPKNIIDKFTYEEICNKYSLDPQQQEAVIDYIYNENIQFEHTFIFRLRYETAKRIIKIKNDTSIIEVIAILCEDILNSGDHLSDDEVAFFNFAMSEARDYVNLNIEPTLSGYCEYFELMLNEIVSSSEFGVQIMTIHKSKGLEFDCVFIPGVKVGNFPNDFHVSDEHKMEEERRLLYVAITRAKERLYLSNGNINAYSEKLKDGFVSEIRHALADKKTYENRREVKRKSDIVDQIIERNDERILGEKERTVIDASGFREITKNVILKWVSNEFPMLTREIKSLCENTEELIADISRKMEPSRPTLLNNRSFIYGTLKLILDDVLSNKTDKITKYLKMGSIQKSFDLIALHKELIKSNKISKTYAPNSLICLAEYKVLLDSLHHKFESSQWKGTKKNIEEFNNKENYQKIELFLSPIRLLDSITLDSKMLSSIEQRLRG